MDHRQHFDKIAPRWESMLAGAPTRRLLEVMSTLDISPEQRILDVGCGTGVLLPILLSRVSEPTRILGLDVSREMLRIAYSKGFGVPLLQADGQCLPLTSSRFDWVVANSVLPHFGRILDALREFHRLLKVGGQLAVCHVDSRETVNARHQLIGGAVANDFLPSDDELRQLMAQAQFTEVRIQNLMDRFLLTAVRR